VKELKENLKFAWKFFDGQKRRLFFYILFNVFQIVISIVVPIFSAKVIMALTNSMFKQLIFVSLVLMGVEIFRNFMNFATAYFSQTIHRETFTKIQSTLGEEI